jgi:HTH-type transcriptional regulator/antitoxin HigA
MPPVTVHPIRTDADHRAALARIEHLMAADNPADDDELTVLAALVEDWEDRHIPMAPRRRPDHPNTLTIKGASCPSPCDP